MGNGSGIYSTQFHPPALVRQFSWGPTKKRPISTSRSRHRVNHHQTRGSHVSFELSIACLRVHPLHLAHSTYSRLCLPCPGSPASSSHPSGSGTCRSPTRELRGSHPNLARLGLASEAARCGREVYMIWPNKLQLSARIFT